MKELEQKDIIGYMPYSLHCETEYGLADVVKIDVFRAIVIVSTAEKYSVMEECYLTEIKPILYPLSSLYGKRMHNGKEIMPILELAKIACPNQNWELWNNIAIYRGGSEQYFMFTGKDGAVKNLPAVFDYLNELKIDYRGLIDAALAIDVNTLKINPYITAEEIDKI